MINRRVIPARTLLLTCALCAVALSACGEKESAPLPKTSGALSAIQTIDTLVNITSMPTVARNAAQLGIFVSEYLTTVPTAMASESALLGIGAQMQIVIAQQTILNPDYDLLQAFGDALQVDVADLLNRSNDRQDALDVYTEALTNVATRANDRFKELQSQLKELKDLASSQNRERSAAERDLKEAIRDKNFDAAGEKQKAVSDFQAAFAETDLKRKQVQSLVDTLDDLLQLYGKKILAIEQNREALIAGVKVIDVPGADELQVLEKKRATRSGGRDGYDALFDESLIQ